MRYSFREPPRPLFTRDSQVECRHVPNGEPQPNTIECYDEQPPDWAGNPRIESAPTRANAAPRTPSSMPDGNPNSTTLGGGAYEHAPISQATLSRVPQILDFGDVYKLTAQDTRYTGIYARDSLPCRCRTRLKSKRRIVFTAHVVSTGGSTSHRYQVPSTPITAPSGLSDGNSGQRLAQVAIAPRLS